MVSYKIIRREEITGAMVRYIDRVVYKIVSVYESNVYKSSKLFTNKK